MNVHRFLRTLLPTLVAGLGVCLAGPAAAGEAPLDPAPALEARDLDGAPYDLAASVQDGPVVVTFWATWCKPCRKELPELQKLVEEFGERGFEVAAISGDGPVDAAKIRPYVRSQGFDFTVIRDPDGEIRRRFQVEVFPTTFVVDREGRIRHRQVGYRQGDEAVVRAAIEEILGEAAPAPATGTRAEPR